MHTSDIRRHIRYAHVPPLTPCCLPLLSFFAVFRCIRTTREGFTLICRYFRAIAAGYTPPLRLTFRHVYFRCLLSPPRRRVSPSGRKMGEAVGRTGENGDRHRRASASAADAKDSAPVRCCARRYCHAPDAPLMTGRYMFNSAFDLTDNYSAYRCRC